MGGGGGGGRRGGEGGMTGGRGVLDLAEFEIDNHAILMWIL